MDHAEQSLQLQRRLGLLWVPIHAPPPETPLALCLLYQALAEPGEIPWILLRDVPGSRVYLGAACDSAGRVLEWLEIWVQEPYLKNSAFATHGKPLDNSAFDQRWRAEFDSARQTLPDSVLVTGMEQQHPRPILVKKGSDATRPMFARSESAAVRLCTEDDLLKSLGLPAYSTSSYRYLSEMAPGGKRTLIATTSEAPRNGQVQGPEVLSASPDVQAVFNLHAGLLRVTRFSPLDLEDYLQVLEGRVWPGPLPQFGQLWEGSTYGQLAHWSTERKAGTFLLQQDDVFGQRLEEVFFLKTAALLALVTLVRSYVKAQQIPLLNLSPTSFRLSLPNVGSQFPTFWAANFHLVRPSQSFPLNVGLIKQKYFVRLGETEPSPFLPGGLGASAFGTGSIRVRNVVQLDKEGAVLEGTLLAEDYLGVNADDLLWFKLPVSQERLEFFAQISTSEQVGPKEARFRTLPAVLSQAVLAKLKGAVGSAFPRSPYEICPLLSSPCDLFSLGVIGIRLLFANGSGNLPVILDEVLSLAQRLAKESTDTRGLLTALKALAARDPHLLDLISPHSLVESGDSPEQARAKVPLDLWLEAVAILIRFFPGLGPASFCKNLGEAAPEALETIFDRPIAELERLVAQLRKHLVPSVAANQEIARVLLEELAATHEG